MSTQSVSLPVVAGGVGAGVDVSALSLEKFLILTGVSGAVTVEASDDDSAYCPVASFSSAKSDAKVSVVAKYLRVNASGGGSADSAEAVAEAAVNRFAAIPAPPAGGAGAAVDIAAFGPHTTVMMGGVSGSVGIEVSADGVNWTPDYKTFTGDGCDTKNISAKYMRAVSLGGTATSLFVGSMEAPSAEGNPTVYWKPDAPGDQLGGASFDKFYEAHAEIEALLAQGYPAVDLIVDPRWATDTLTYDPGGANEVLTNVCTVGLRPGEAASIYDMSDVMVRNQFTGNFVNISFADNAQWRNPKNFKGYRMQVISDSDVTPAILVNTTGIGFFGGRQEFFCAKATAKPVFQQEAGSFFAAFFNSGENIWTTMFGRTGYTALAPALDINGGFCAIEYWHHGAEKDSVMDGVGGGFVKWIPQCHDAINSYNQAGLAGATQEVLFWNGVNTRLAQPGNDVRFLVGPTVYDASDEWGVTYMCDTTAGDVTINLASAKLAIGETYKFINVTPAGGLNNVVPVPAAGEACDIATVPAASAEIVESDGSKTPGSAGRWVKSA